MFYIAGFRKLFSLLVIYLNQLLHAQSVSGSLQAVSPDGEAIVTGAGDETLRFWNVFSKTRCTKVRLSNNMSRVLCLDSGAFLLEDGSHRSSCGNITETSKYFLSSVCIKYSVQKDYN